MSCHIIEKSVYPKGEGAGNWNRRKKNKSNKSKILCVDMYIKTDEQHVNVFTKSFKDTVILKA